MLIKRLGNKPYLDCQTAMQTFVERSTNTTESEIWFVQHPKVYTQGVSCDLVTLQAAQKGKEIPIVKSDRGGQITYHGPGQVVMYTLLNVKQLDISVRGLVRILEQIMIDVLDDFEIPAKRKSGAPGVYVNEAKIGALGLRFRKGFSYHGLSLNVDMDLRPFENIDPCGYQGMKVTQIKDELLTVAMPTDQIPSIKQVENRLVKKLKEQFAAYSIKV